MAGEWIKMEVALPDKPEVLRVARVLGIDKDSVIGKLVRLWAWFDRNSVDGAVDGVVGADIDAICYQNGFAEALMSVGWLAIDTARERVEIPRFDRHNGESAKKRSLKNERQARWRSGTSTDASTEEPQKATTREEKRREEKDSPPTPSEPSAIGAVGKALKGAGIDPQTINLSDPILRSLVEQGATPEEFAGLAREAITGGKRNPIAWVLAVLPQRRSDAANVRLAAAPVVKSESSEDYVKRMAEEREAERKRLEGSTGPPPELRDKVKAMVKGMRV